MTASQATPNSAKRIALLSAGIALSGVGILGVLLPLLPTTCLLLLALIGTGVTIHLRAIPTIEPPNRPRLCPRPTSR